MKLKSQVTSPELSKRLKELGVKQESYFCWIVREDQDASEATLECNDENIHKDGEYGWIKYSAYTVAELGEMLPGYECGMTNSTPGNPPEGYLDGIELVHVHENGRWVTRVGESYYDANNEDYPEFKDQKEAEARGLMLEYLVKNNLLSV
jgi:hypothetical protein